MQTARDCILDYDYEGQGSYAGSVSYCSLLEPDNDLHFFDDLGSKFKTLAEICSSPKSPTTLIPRSIVTPVVDKVDHVAGLSSEIKANNFHGKSLKCNQDVVISQSTDLMRSHIASTSSMHGQTSNNVMGFNGTASSSQYRPCSLSIMPQSPLVSPVSLLPSPIQAIIPQQQQSVYYISSPVMQPMNYIVQPQLQSTMMLAEAPVSSLQTMILYGGNTAGSLPPSTRRGNRVAE
ncbi:hypothetical protein PBY51_024125 [Eleginops maclovinus]|uniref:Cadherin Y-type LIR-motif domain-containing protein n=1 Tax=Eleginops maclovinus TaxID=56733 RepID=A0AAN7XZ08_ELEMC|nr:hypothetical protein PBY51_024125 [Eleginops maclovinus]